MARESKAKEVKRLHEAGLTPREIARTLDLSVQGVHWHLDRLGLKKKDRKAS